MRKRGYEFNFAWLFAIIAGAVILFLAIYIAVKMVGTERYKLDTVTAKQLSIIFEPLETGLASGKSNIARLRDDTRIYNKCYSADFGKNRISLATKSSIGNAWSKPGVDIPISNKYIFSNGTEEGRVIYFFSKPFRMPFKVSEIIFLSANSYCFVNAPEEIKNEVSGLNLENIKTENCSGNEIRVCFGAGSCDIRVEGACLDYTCESQYDKGIVVKDNDKLYYDGFASDSEVDRSLMYAAIFSDKQIYECNIKRLMERLAEQALVYKDEASFLIGKCSSVTGTSLIQLSGIAKSLTKSQDLTLVKVAAGNADKENSGAECRLW